MSFGKSSSKQSSDSQSTSTQALDPQIKAALLQNYGTAQNTVGQYQPYTGQLVAPTTAATTQAQQGILGIANQNVGNAELNNAISTTGKAANYSPTQVAASTYAPTTGNAALTGAASAGPAAQSTAAQIDPNAVQNITAPTVGADQINAFLNPYTNDVVNTTNADLYRQQQIQNLDNAKQATQQGAFGGSGSAVLNSLTNDSYIRAIGAQDASLNQQGYTTALTAAQQQAAQQLVASQANQSTNLQAGTTNANLTQQTGLANQAATNTQNQFNAQQLAEALQSNQAAQNTFGLANLNAANTAGQFNAGQTQSAQTANQSAGLAGQQLNLAAGQQQSSLSAQQLAQALGIQSAVGTVGAQQQAQQQAVDTANLGQFNQNEQYQILLQQLLNQSLGLAGNPVLGSSQSTSQGSGSSTSTNFNSGLSFAPIPL